MTGTCHNIIPVHVTKIQVVIANIEYDRDMSQLHTSVCHQKTSEFGKERVLMTGTCHNNIPVHITKRQVNMAKSEYL